MTDNTATDNIATDDIVTNDIVTDDIAALHRINAEIGDAECRADRPFFEEILSPRFVMGRPDGSFDDKEGFISGLRANAERRTQILEISVLPVNRAFVTCLVTKVPLDDPAASPARFHNLRVFARSEVTADWQLVTWLNEPASA